MEDNVHFCNLCLQLLWHLVCYNYCVANDYQTLARYCEDLVNENIRFKVLRMISAWEALLSAIERI